MYTRFYHKANKLLAHISESIFEKNIRSYFRHTCMADNSVEC